MDGGNGHSAAYTAVTVVPASEQPGDYISKVHLRVEKGETTKEVETATLDGEDALWIPSELSDGNFYVKAELTDDIPEGAAVYAVYSQSTGWKHLSGKADRWKRDILKKYNGFPVCKCNFFHKI